MDWDDDRAHKTWFSNYDVPKSLKNAQLERDPSHSTSREDA